MQDLTSGNSNLSKGNSNLSKGPTRDDILTVMDADTCFAQDYFSAISCHYACADKEDRPLMLFTPCTVFDRYLLLTLGNLILTLGNSTLTLETHTMFRDQSESQTCCGRLLSCQICTTLRR
jgi:hypothetical protein